ncbi:MAG: nucleotidyltransferase domain-containing protein [Bacteroidota bacterium]
MPANSTSVLAFEKPLISATSRELLRVLLYFDIFDYPLTATEIFERSAIGSVKDLYKELDHLTANGFIFRYGGFYSTQDNPALISRRIRGNECAGRHMKKAKLISSIIGHFPFVRSVMLSGSISKMYMDDKSDIDYFVITAPNRLWIARFFFVLFHKIILLNKTKLFCYNYMIAADHLSISKRNIYTATEIVTLLPTLGAKDYQQFLRTNAWVKDYFPNFPVPDTDDLKTGRSWFKRCLEKLLSGKMGEKLDIYLMKHTERRWHKRQPPHMFSNPEAYMSLKRHTAKGHTQDHYPRILTCYEENLRRFEAKHRQPLSVNL